ncbi:MAG: ribosome small subunit-dependent GTPase A [Xanthomonadales bacterium PRO6]|nr:putative ribosome biogenesis GTPase RsgA [Xanthomonadales bacterium]MCE7932196.1 ribosome small subunit-dependent GTPase A [Xanthomonadales bacterium PRO6]
MLTPADIERLSHIGFCPLRWPGLAVPRDSFPARIVEQHRSGYVIHDGSDTLDAKSLPRLRHRVEHASERPCVGDWCLAAQRHGGEWMIEELLPRFSTLVRGAAGETQSRQAIAANIDHVLIVTGLDRDYNLRRIERYLVLVSASGARPTLVLTKADKSEDIERFRAEVQVIAPGTPVHAVNAKSADSCAALAASLRPGETAVLVGSSGAGKSTLTNTLLGAEAQATGAIRASDGRGRHTTVSRALKPLPGGACLIDTPGLREVKLTGDEDLADAGFEDIETLTSDCRFRDCRHEREPGCAVRAAVVQGELDPARLASWRKLGNEIARAGENALQRVQRRQHDAAMAQALRDVLKKKGRK